MGHAAVAGLAAPTLLAGCAAPFRSYRASVTGGTIEVPQGMYQDLIGSNEVLLIHPDKPIGTIMLRHTKEHGFLALSTTCTHKGCEVRPTPTAFQCPCHGSEYAITGELVDGPASGPLQKFQVERIHDLLIIRINHE